MKESVNKFDFHSVFNALNDIDIPEVETSLPHTQKKADLKEAVAARSYSDRLIEDFYDVNSGSDLEAAKDKRSEAVARAKLDKIEKIVDLDAEDPNDLDPVHEGKIIIRCPQCQTLFFKDPEDIVPSEDDEKTVNINDACPNCKNISGYEVVGRVAGFDDTSDVTDDAPVDDEMSDVEGEPTEDAGMDEVNLGDGASDEDLDLNFDEGADEGAEEPAEDAEPVEDEANEDEEDEEPKKVKESLELSEGFDKKYIFYTVFKDGRTESFEKVGILPAEIHAQCEEAAEADDVESVFVSEIKGGEEIPLDKYTIDKSEVFIDESVNSDISFEEQFLDEDLDELDDIELDFNDINSEVAPYRVVDYHDTGDEASGDADHYITYEFDNAEDAEAKFAEVIDVCRRDDAYDHIVRFIEGNKVIKAWNYSDYDKIVTADELGEPLTEGKFADFLAKAVRKVGGAVKSAATTVADKAKVAKDVVAEKTKDIAGTVANKAKAIIAGTNIDNMEDIKADKDNNKFELTIHEDGKDDIVRKYETYDSFEKDFKKFEAAKMNVTGKCTDTEGNFTKEFNPTIAAEMIKKAKEEAKAQADAAAAARTDARNQAKKDRANAKQDAQAKKAANELKMDRANNFESYAIEWGDGNIIKAKSLKDLMSKAKVLKLTDAQIVGIKNEGNKETKTEVYGFDAEGKGAFKGDFVAESFEECEDGECLREDSFDDLLATPEFKKPVSEAEIDAIIADAHESDPESVKALEGFEDIDDESLEKRITESLSHVYCNVESFKASGCELKEGLFTISGNVNFTTGVSKPVTFQFNKVTTAGNKVSLLGESANVANGSDVIIECVNNNGTLISESVRCVYSFGDKLTESVTK